MNTQGLRAESLKFFEPYTRLQHVVKYCSRCALALLFLLAATTQAQFTYTTNNDGTLTLTRYTGYDQTLTISATVNGLPVTGLGDTVFSYSPANVALPATITNISDLAFYGCHLLRAITVDPLNPAYCSVDGVLFNRAQTRLLQCPGSKAGSYAVPESVTALGKWAFNWCYKLTNITISASVTNLETIAFTACGSLTAITVDPLNPVYSTEEGILFDKHQATLLYYPLAKDGSDYLVPNSVTTIADEAFDGQGLLTRVTIGNSVTNIGREAFRFCEGLTNVIIGHSVTSIGESAFHSCRNLTSVTIGTNATSLGNGVFALCSSLNSLVLPDSITSIGDRAFWDCSSLTNLVLGRGITLLPRSMFSGCERLRNFTIPDSVTSIGTWAFSACGSLTALRIPNSVTNIDAEAFTGCVRLSNVTLSTNLTCISSRMFYACSSLPSVEIPASVTNIAAMAFHNCTNLAAVTVDALNAAYSSCDGACFDKNQTRLIRCPEGKAGTLIIPDSTTTIEAEAFYQCARLTHITIPGSVTAVGAKAFAHCHNLTSVVLGDNITTIGNYAFDNCAYLATVTMPGQLTNIGTSLFGSCYRLKEVYWPGNAPTFGFNEFYYSYLYPTIYYLPGTTGWGAKFGGVPTAPWQPRVRTTNAGFGPRTNQFGFNISWASGMVVAVDACTDLANPNWTPLQTNTLTGSTLSFTDAQWTNHPARFYRIRRP